MNVLIISDQDFQTGQYTQLAGLLTDYFSARDFAIEQIQLGRDDLAFCVGCFGCWVRKPGECVILDRMSQINRATMNSDVVIYLCHVVFGQFSANMKNAIDRWLPNMLPFFMIRPDGSTMHPPRYDDYPKQIMIGYADALSTQDALLFTDITQKHRSNVEVLIWRDAALDITQALDKIKMERIGGLL